MAVYVQVAAAGDAYIKQAVAGEASKHVVKKPMPVCRSALPVPSRSIVSVICVSRVLRVTVAVRAIGIPLFSALN